MDTSVNAIQQYMLSFIEVEASDISNQMSSMWIQQGFDDLVGSDVRWPFYEVGDATVPYQIITVSGQQNYEMPTVLVQGTVYSATVDPHKIVSIQGPHWELLYASQTALESTYTPDTIVQQEPDHYSFWGQSGVTLWPIPNGGYTLNVRAYRDPVGWVDMGAGGMMDAPNDFFSTLCAFVLSKGLAQQTDLQSASYWDNQYAMGKARLMRKYLRAPMPESIVLNGGETSRSMPPRLRFPFEGLSSIGIGR